ncbi:MAG: Rpn family recombination-promoting nuclease/putative transposase, partial [Spirochaetales bacterium]|nr:Rpn family recombination-promoting nuclease/putative transposase [Spirochaetales bacterium]
MAIHKAKDNSFKIILGNHELFVEFLRDFIPISILKDVKAEDIEDMSERFLPLFQEGRDSDTVKRINLQGTPLFVIAIAEHESEVNYRASFKMLQYICLVLDQYEKDVNKEQDGFSLTKEFRYPPVLPIIFYDGPKNWTAQMNFADRTEMKDVFSK